MRDAPGDARSKVVLALATVILATGACGSEEAAPSSDSSLTPSDTDFVVPRDTDLLLADLQGGSSGPLSIGFPTNVTQRVDYDNQPHFLPGGGGVLYTAIDSHTGQADIYRYDPAGETVDRVTSSNPESEYSATPLPDGSGISVVRVEADSTRRLWRFDLDGTDGAVLLEEVEPVGYHAWIDENSVALFVLGDPPTLRIADLRTGRARVVARDIGRSLQHIPETFDVSFVQRHDDGSSTIMRLPGDGGEPQPIVEAVGGGDFHAWTPDGTLLMAEGSVIHAASADRDWAWTAIADFSELAIVVSRLAVSPDASQVALVAEPAPLDSLPGG